MSERIGSREAEAQAKLLDRVLGAEKQAAKRIKEAHAEADAIVDLAKQATRLEAERADRRIQALYLCFRKRLKEQQNRIDAAFGEEHASSEQDFLSEEELDALVERIARRLMGQQE